MYFKIALSFLIIAYAKANDVVLPYTTVAYTTSGEPCIGGCSPHTHQCVASWPPKNEPCVLHTTAAPRFKTTQTETSYPYCLSNCGKYEWSTPWCYVTSDGEYDYCTETPVGNQISGTTEVLPYTTAAYTTTGKPCIGGCSPYTHQCVAHWPPKNEPCVDYGTPAPTAYTTQKYTSYSTCLSNCGAYSWDTPWCYVTTDGKWDYCTPQQSTSIVNTNTNIYANTNQNAMVLPYEEEACTSSGAPCIGGCSPVTHQCAVGYPPKNEPCIPSNTLAPRFRTTQTYSIHRSCISNCGSFAGRLFAWCYVTYDGQFDTCLQSTEHQNLPMHTPTRKPFNFDLNFGTGQNGASNRKPFNFDLNFGG